ncbi:hypothetical protein BH24BAC1_BH24BAC1_00010 [soil metagenome]
MEETIISCSGRKAFPPLSLRGQKGFSLFLAVAIPRLGRRKRPLFHSWGIASLPFAMTAKGKGHSFNKAEIYLKSRYTELLRGNLTETTILKITCLQP